MRIFLLILALIISTAGYTQDLSLGLQAYYPFNGNANDASGNGNNPVFNNAALTSDKNGNANSAYHFNGTSTYIQVPSSASLNMATTMSIAARVRPTGFYTGFCYNNMMVSKGESDQESGIYSLRFSDQVTGCTGNPTTATEQFYGVNTIAAQPYVSLNQWYDVVWTCDGTTSKIYVNCVLQGTGPAPASFSNSLDLYMGKMNNVQYPFWLNGDLDEVRIYNRALTVAEVNLYSGCSILPVRLTDFMTSVVNNEKILLSWNTAEESDIIKYVVERAVAESNEYKAIGEIAPENRPGKKAYSFTDRTAVPNTLYNYRIRIATADGAQKYSPVRNAKIVNNAVYTNIYPNPAREVIRLQVNNYTGTASVSVTDAMGKVVKTEKVSITSGNIVMIDIKALSAGNYWIHVQTSRDKTVSKIIIL